MFRKENMISELHTKKGTWKIAVQITDMWHVNKHNGKQAIEMVFMDQTGAKIGVTLWQELFPEFEVKLNCGSTHVIQNIKVVENHSEYKVSRIPFLVYLVKTTSVKEVERPEIPTNVHVITPFANIIDGVVPRDTLVDVVGVVVEVIERKTVNPTYRVTIKLRDNNYSDRDMILTCWEEYALPLDDAIEKNHFDRKPLVVMLTLAKIKDPKDQGSVSQSQYSQYSQRSSMDKFLHNAQMVMLGEISRLRQSGDDIKVFPPCVDELLGKTWAVRFKYRVQMHQSSVLDVTEDEDLIQTMTSTIALQGLNIL
ncbi:hypothetical protein glysoja_046757 [Glycine soja]|uniref:Replication protein A 70 kDa DNA-binding subunit B/D first OB fold domain-containing protein n=1 Tax=Glycine soja TaxID=3848 RepID=A0A0B2PSE7_GLYSO|nr:hypothetical protein glysoja_046757 [Glycine soja]